MNNRRALRPVWITLAIFAVVLASVGAYLVWAASRSIAPPQDLQVLQPGDLRVSPTAIPTGQEVVGGNLSVTNSLRVANNIVGGSITITPSNNAPSAGQLYVTNDNALHYYDGQSTTNISAMGDIQKSNDTLKQTVAQLQSRQDQIQAAVAAQAAAPQGVLTLQGQSGDIVLTGGAGVAIAGTTISNTGVTSLGGSTGGIGIGSGLEIVGNTLMNTKVTQIVSGSADITVIRDESGMYTISYTGSGQGGTVALGPTTPQQDTTNGSSIWINKTGVGNLLQLSTGTTPINRFVVDNSGAILTGTIGFNQVTGLPSLVNTIAGRTGDLLLGSGLTVSGNTISSTAVVSVGGLTGSISLGSGLGVSGGQLVSTASGVGSVTGTTNQITATGTGAVTLSLPQDIATSSTPTFGGLTLATPLAITSGGTGANTAAAARTNLGAAKSGANSDITTLSAATSVGSTGQTLTLQGATTTLSSTSGATTTTLAFAAPTANVTYRLQAAVAGTYDVCTTVGNCTGVGGGVTSPGGTIGHLARYISGSAIGDSIISDNGSTVSIAGALNVNNITPTAAAIIGATTQSLTLQGSNTSISSTNSVTTNTLQFTTPSGAAKSIVIPNASGTVAVAASGPIVLGVDGTLSCPTCLVSGGGGGGNSGVSSVNGLSGSINVKSITASSIVTSGSDITIQDASTTVKGLASFNGTNFTVSSGAVNTVQDITVSATPTFGGMVLTGPNSLTLGSAVNAGKLLFKDGSSAFGSSFTASPLTADHSIVIPDASGTLAVSASGNIALSSGGDISFTGLLPVAQGGTGANTALGARAALGVAASGSNTDITALTGLTTALTVPQGGTGTNNLLQNGVLVGQGTAPITSLVAGAAGQCLMSTAGAPVFQACPGSGGVVSVNGGMGAITLAGTSAGSVSTAGNAITINDATTSTKGLASFSAANFTVTGGMANTIQGIGPTSSPTFNALTLTTPLGVANGGIGLNSVATNGQILIGNGSGYSLNTLTAGPGISILNTAGSISLSAPGSGNCASCALQSLSNLSAVAINVSLLPVSTNLIDVGSASLAMRSGYFGSMLQAASFDKSSAGALDIGTTNATQINLNKNVAIAANQSITYAAGTGGFNQSASTGTLQTGTGSVSLNGDTTLASGKALSVQGVSTFQNATDSTNAFNVNSSVGSSVFKVDTLNGQVGINNASPAAPLDVVGVGSRYVNGFESGGLSPLTTATPAYWGVQAISSAHAGSYALVGNYGGNAPTGTDYTTALTQTLSASGTVSFYYMCDWSYGVTMSFQVDSGPWNSFPTSNGNCQGTLSNGSTYGFASYGVGAGSHTFTWKFNRGAPSVNNFRVRIDDITVTNVGATGTAALFNNGGVGIGLGVGIQPAAALDINGTIQGSSSLSLGKVSTTSGSLTFANATSAGTVTVISAPQSASYTLTIPTLTSNASICTDLGNCAAGAGSNYYIQNQTAFAQPSTNFWISGNGQATSLQASSFDTGAAGTLALGTTNATGINLNQNTTLAANKSFTITGGATGTRPAAPTEGMMYYDNTTHTLLTWNGTKWMSDKSTATKVVAMGATTGCVGTSPVASANPDGADYVVSSCTSAQTTINAAIAALPATGGTVYLQEGTYIVDGVITLPKSVTLTGVGGATVLKLKDGINADVSVITDVSSGTGNQNTISNLMLDGNKANNTSGTQRGINLAPFGAAPLLVDSVTVTNFRSAGLVSSSAATTVTSSVFSNNGGYGIDASGGNVSVSNSTMTGNTSGGIYLSGVNRVVGNNISSNGGGGVGSINVNDSVISNNIVNSNAGTGISAYGGSGNSITGNIVKGSGGTGISAYQSDKANISSNEVSNSSNDGISAYGSDIVINGNRIDNNGGTGSSSGISTGNVVVRLNVTNNNITDTAGTGYAIDISPILGSATYLSNNVFSGIGASSIRDSLSDTVYVNQMNAKNGQLIIKSTAGVGIGTTNATSSLTLQGAMNTVALSAPANLSTSRSGTAGTTSYTYVVTAFDGLGETLPSATMNFTTSNAVLDGTNYNTVSWGVVNGAVGYKVYRTVSGGTPSTTGYIGTLMSAGYTVDDSYRRYNFNDTGLIATTAAPLVNTTGGANFAGQIQGGSASLGGSLSVAGATGANYFNVNTSSNQITIGTAGPTLPMAINDDYTLAAPTGTLRNSAAYVANSYVQLSGSANSSGQVEYTPAITSTDFDSMFGMWSSGADGNYLYAYTTTTPTSFNQSSGGYVFAIDAYNSQAAIYFNGAKLASSPLASAGDSTWHNIEARKVGTTLTMYRDGVSILTYNDISRSLTGTKFGVGGWGGGLGTGVHRVQNLKFQFGTTPMVNTTVNMVLNGAQTIQTATNSTTAFQVQNASATPLLVADTTNMTVTIVNLAVTGTMSLTGPLTVGGTATFNGALTVAGATNVGNITVNGHIITGGTIPTIAVKAAACTTPTVTIAGTDTAGLITLTTGTGCIAPGALATITFATAFGTTPRVTLTPATSAAASLPTFVDDASLTTTSYTINAVATPTDATTYKWYYHALQ
jgi:hypothetical protein